MTPPILSVRPRRPWRAVLFALALASSPGALAEEPAPAPAKPRPPPPPEIPGVRWEADVEAGLARAAREGRPVLVVVNALEEESATRMLAEQAYPSAPWGEASRPFVCFVANGNQHEEAPVGGRSSCSRFPGIPCSAHRDVLTWVLRRFSSDGESLTSPSHLILEPDGGVAYKKEFYTQDESPPFLDTWAAWTAPRLAAKRAWIVREARLAALEKTPVEKLEEASRAWLASGDGYAAPGLVAALELETKPEREAAIRSALASAPQASWPALFDDVEAATADPDGEPDVALAWVKAALGVDPDLGAWAACRVLARTRTADFRANTIAAWAGEAGKGVEDLPEGARARAAEALVLGGDEGARRLLGKTELVTDARLRRTRSAGETGAAAEDVADVARSTRAQALSSQPAAWVEKHVEIVRAARGDRHRDVRLAAAIALLRVGDRSGADDLLEALDDLVEGPEVHQALVRWHGSDPGSDAASWTDVLRAPAKEDGK